MFKLGRELSKQSGLEVGLWGPGLQGNVIPSRESFHPSFSNAVNT